MTVNYAIIGKRIATRRKQLKHTQAELAEKINLSAKYISNIETAKSTPSLETILQICRALEVDNVNYILFGANDTAENSTKTEIDRHLSVCTQQELDDVLAYVLFALSRRNT